MPVAAADPLPFLSGSTREASLVGDVQATGDLSYFASLGRHDQQDPASRLPPGSPEIAPTTITLFAESVDAQTDVMRSDPTVLFVGPVQSYSVENRTFAGGVSFSSSAIRPGFDFFLAPSPGRPLPRVSLSADSGVLRAVPAPGKESNKIVAGPHEALPSAGQATMAWTPVSSWRTLSVEGDFTLVAWEMDFHATSSEAAVDLATGYVFKPAAPVPTGDVNTVGSVEMRQTYLAVHAGTISFTFAAAPTAQLDFSAVHANVGYQVTLPDADGSVQGPAGPEAFSRRDVFVQGILEVSFADAGATVFDARVSGDAAQAVVGGKVYHFSPQGSVGARGVAVTPTAWLPVAGGAVVVAGLGAYARRRSQVKRMNHLELLMEAAMYRDAARSAGRLVRSRRHGQDAQVIQTVSLLRLGRLPEAQACLRSWRGPQAATVDYLWAFLHALRGESREARIRLDQCLAKDREMHLEIDTNPVFQRLSKPAGPAAHEAGAYT
ncbi:MAG: hypothetical protein V4510_10355 [bacterium]